jgi:nucleoside-diphosphate-sugar epimerase
MPIPDLSSRTVLVTGGAGFIGSHLVDALHARGARVRVIDDFSAGRRVNLGPHLDHLHVLEADIRDRDACARACEGVELVFHLAAVGSVPRSLADPATTLSVNVAGATNVFTAARDAKVRRVVYASSSSVYGDSAALPKREGEEGQHLSPYALSKVMTEQLASMFHRCYEMQIIGLRYFNVFGPRQDPDGPYAAVVPRFFKTMLSGDAPTIYGDGLQSRDFTYVDDAVNATLLAASAGEVDSERGYNVAGGRAVTILQLASTIRDLVGGSPDAVHSPERCGDIRHSLADLSRSRRELAYEPHISLAQGLERTAEHYRRELAAA